VPRRPGWVRNATLAADQLRSAILDGTLKPGQRLKEEDLAQELDISRTPVREALAALQSEGLVDIVQKKGATVRPFTLGDLEESYRLRALLEGHASYRAAGRITDDELRALSESMDRIISYDAVRDYAAAVAENLTFHKIILSAAHSPRLEQLHAQVTQVPSVYRSYYWYTPETRAISEQFHRWILRALRGHDAERAQRVAMEHVIHARDVLLEHFHIEGTEERGEPALPTAIED
jgi:DNA-binding GntR family transcriptional regulator